MSLIRTCVNIPTKYGDCCFYSFSGLTDQKEHVALVFKNVDIEIPPLLESTLNALQAIYFHPIVATAVIN